MFTPAQSDSELRAVETQVGRQFPIHLGYFDWSLDFTSFARTDLAAGRIPYVTIEPFNMSLDKIASGSEDAVIRARATSVKGLSGKILLRFAHEMNGNWYAWDGYHNGANAAAAQKYVAAYRHLHDVFKDAGATNVLWVFCPNVDSVPSESWNQWSNYYPGDQYVDWMCFDGYNWGTDTFESMTSRIYPGLAAKGKPIMLGETSTKDVEKATWISAILPAMKSRFPLLKALVWFNVNKENDWRFDSTTNSRSAFVTMAKDPYFNPK
jgi:beta-mannanase